MRLTSRQRVLAAFAHEQPDRVPLWCGASVEFWLKAKRELGLDDEGLRVRFGDDFRRVFADYVGPEYPLKHEEATCRTVFGVERTGLGYGQPLDHPLAGASLKEVHAYAWPDPAWMDTTKIKAAAEAYGGEYAILGGDWSPFWHDAIDLLGMENMCMKMYDAPAVVELDLEGLRRRRGGVGRNRQAVLVEHASIASMRACWTWAMMILLAGPCKGIASQSRRRAWAWAWVSSTFTVPAPGPGPLCPFSIVPPNLATAP